MLKIELKYEKHCWKLGKNFNEISENTIKLDQKLRSNVEKQMKIYKKWLKVIKYWTKITYNWKNSITMRQIKGKHR